VWSLIVDHYEQHLQVSTFTIILLSLMHIFTQVFARKKQKDFYFVQGDGAFVQGFFHDKNDILLCPKQAPNPFYIQPDNKSIKTTTIIMDFKMQRQMQGQYNHPSFH
jgi:hypothetical protein